MNIATEAKIPVQLINQVLNYILSQPTNRPVGEVLQLVNQLQNLPLIETPAEVEISNGSYQN